MSIETNLGDQNQKDPFAKTLARWFAANVAGGLVVALLIYFISTAASVRREDIVHWFGGITKQDLANYVQYNNAISLKVKEGGDSGKPVFANHIDRLVHIWDGQADAKTECKLYVEQWKE